MTTGPLNIIRSAVMLALILAVPAASVVTLASFTVLRLRPKNVCFPLELMVMFEETMSRRNDGAAEGHVLCHPLPSR